MESLCRFYTSSIVSNLLVSKFRQHSPGRVLDMGVGGGSLLKAAYERWRNADFYAIDLDGNRILENSSSFSFAKFRHIDGLSPSLADKMNIKIGSIDVAVCNPPYYRIERTDDMKCVFEESGLSDSKYLKRITSDVVFLAQNLQMLKDGGELGIILPDGIFTGREFEPTRKDLLENHTILGVIQLPDNIFLKTEARTHILLLEKGVQRNADIPLYRSNTYGDLEEVIYITPEEALQRMDYSFYKWKTGQYRQGAFTSLEEIGAEIKRGRNTRKDLESLGINYFHTTALPDSVKKIHVKNSDYGKDIKTKPGDILLARVGKRCIGRAVMVKSGSIVVTDCIYRIRVSEEFNERVWKSFVSKEGQDWLKAHAHGVCSRCISKKDLLSFPVPV
ncbi:MAG: N-6 DNA methylase [bacterium]|nr:N-6 DNA methylase [bacterium]